MEGDVALIDILQTLRGRRVRTSKPLVLQVVDQMKASRMSGKLWNLFRDFGVGTGRQWLRPWEDLCCVVCVLTRYEKGVPIAW